jgi:hypothetical protein
LDREEDIGVIEITISKILDSIGSIVVGKEEIREGDQIEIKIEMGQKLLGMEKEIITIGVIMRKEKSIKMSEGIREMKRENKEGIIKKNNEQLNINSFSIFSKLFYK